MNADDPRCARLSELSECAYRLGLAFGREAERAEETARKLEYFRLFDRCFFAVRVATALELRLWRTPAMDRADSDPGLERDRLEAAGDDDRGDQRDDREDRDRDRDREVEPASLPVLLRTLEGVAAEAVALPGPEPAALPTLRELLAHVAPGSPKTLPRPSGPDLRTRLAGSGAAMALQLSPRPTRSLGGPAVRRATGPPRR